MHQIILLARFALCAIFALAALKKLRSRAEVSSGLTDFGIPVASAPAVAVLLAISEVAVAGALLFDRSAAVGALAAIALLVLFTSVLAGNLARGRRPACNCFGADDRRPIGWDTVLRNAALIVLAVLATRANDAPSIATIRASFDALRSQTITGWLLGLCLALLAAVTFALWNVLRQQGRILVRLEALERVDTFDSSEPATAPQRGLPIGSQAPAFSLATLDGGTQGLDELESHDRPLLLVFVNPHCGPCVALLPEIGGWQRDYAPSLTIALVSAGSVADNREKAVPGLEHILLQREHEVADLYHAYGTPAAVLLEDGRIASGVAQGADEIRALVADFFDGRPQPVLGIGDAVSNVPLTTPAGGTVALRDAVMGAETVLLFWNPQCGFCASMLDDLRALDLKGEGEETNLVVVSTLPLGGSADDLRSRVLIDAELRAAAAFGARGTPMAVRVDARGLVASRLAAGRDAILELVRREPVRG